MSVDTQSLKSHVVALGGVPLDGFGQSEAISIVPFGPKFTSVEGVDGSKARAYTGSKSFKITITLLPGSKANKYLTAAMVADEAACEAGTGGVVLPFMWKGNNLDLFIAAECWVIQAPDAKSANTVQDRVWQLETGPGKLFLGA